METKVFVACGSWKNYEELEDEMSIPELVATLNSIVDKDFEDKKFLAAMQGVDLGGEKEDALEAARKKRAAKMASEELGVNLDQEDVVATMPALITYRQINV